MAVYEALAWAAEGVRGGDVVLVSGGARGADRFAEVYAEAMDWGVEVHRADWDQFGRAAGVRRNAEMVALGADVCVALLMPCTVPGCPRSQPHDSHGASDCAERAEAAGIEVRRFRL